MSAISRNKREGHYEGKWRCVHYRNVYRIGESPMRRKDKKRDKMTSRFTRDLPYLG